MKMKTVIFELNCYAFSDKYIDAFWSTHINKANQSQQTLCATICKTTQSTYLCVDCNAWAECVYVHCVVFSLLMADTVLLINNLSSYGRYSVVYGSYSETYEWWTYSFTCRQQRALKSRVEGGERNAATNQLIRITQRYSNFYETHSTHTKMVYRGKTIETLLLSKYFWTFWI